MESELGKLLWNYEGFCQNSGKLSINEWNLKKKKNKQELIFCGNI